MVQMGNKDKHICHFNSGNPLWCGYCGKYEFEAKLAAKEKEITQLTAEVKRLREALGEIAQRWFDPTKADGACVADCEANLPEAKHDDDCPFQIAKQALSGKE